MQIIQKLNQRRTQIWTQLIWLVSLSLCVSLALHTAVSSLFLFVTRAHTHTETPAQKKKWLFQLSSVPPLFSRCSPLPCQEDLHAPLFFFSSSFMSRLSRVDPPPPLLSPPLPPPGPCTNTADRRWRRCHDTVACRPTNPSQSVSQQAPSGLVCVFETVLSVGVCACVHFMGSAFVCVCVSVSLPAHCFCLCLRIIHNYPIAVCPTDREESLLIISFKRKNSDTHSMDRLEELISALDINASLFCASLLRSSILRRISLSPYISVLSIKWIGMPKNLSYRFS